MARQISEFLAKLYQYWLPPISALASLLWLVLAYWKIPPRPPVGAYIACTALLVVIVTIWPAVSNRSRAAWLCVFFCGTVMEILNLYQERDENQTQQANIQKQERKSLKEIADSIQLSVAEMQHLDDLSREEINEVTGGDGFVTLEPSILPIDNVGMRLMAIVHGKYIIRRVGYTVLKSMTSGKVPNMDYINDFLAGRINQQVAVGDLTPSEMLLVGDVLKPPLDKVCRLNIQISALNGITDEELLVRYDTIRSRWDDKVTVRRHDKVIFKERWHWLSDGASHPTPP